jgi:hypothetical protein
MKAGFWDYVREAFNARPIGMFVAPNWIGVAIFGLLGLRDPGFWVLGAGVEMAYLSLLATNPRFQRLVNGRASLGSVRDATDKVTRLLDGLADVDRRRYELLTARCYQILDQQFAGDTEAPGYAMQREGLGRLTWMYLRLLATRQAIRRIVAQPDVQTQATAGAGQPLRPGQGTRPGQPPPIPGAVSAEAAVPNTGARDLERRLAELNRRLQDPALSDDLRRSLTSQADLLQQRMKRRAEAEGKLAYLDAELARIEEQVELIREQAVLSTDPESFSQRIDEIGATLSGTADWVAEQQRTLGAMDDLLGEAPALSGGQARSRQSQ